MIYNSQWHASLHRIDHRPPYTESQCGALCGAVHHVEATGTITSFVAEWLRPDKPLVCDLTPPIF